MEADVRRGEFLDAAPDAGHAIRRPFKRHVAERHRGADILPAADGVEAESVLARAVRPDQRSRHRVRIVREVVRSRKTTGIPIRWREGDLNARRQAA